MKKGVCYIILFFALLALELIVVNGIIGEGVITGKVPSQLTNVSIFVMPAGLPILTIISPESRAYATNVSILLNYTTINANKIWYNLDNGNDITITSPIYFNVSEGSHILYLYANNSQGTTSNAVGFFVNLNYGWHFNSSKYYGNTTNFTWFEMRGKDYMQNMSNFILEIPNFGKIRFNRPINISRDIYLDAYSNIANNTVYIDSNYIPEFNTSATLWFYNLSFANPRISKDNQTCPETICKIESYANGTLQFNVTHFTTYSTEETPSTSGSSGGSTGGGGGTTKTPLKSDFEIKQEKIKVVLLQGETTKEKITIKNTGDEKIKINIQPIKISEFIKISETSFDLEAGKSKEIIIDFIARKNTLPDLYLGKLVIESKNITKEVFVAIDVKSEKPLFDVNVEIPKDFEEIVPGKNIAAKVILYNLKRVGIVDVEVEYIVKDMNDNIIASEKETVAVETQTSLLEILRLPSNIKTGDYIFYVKTKYQGEVATASAWFSVIEEHENPITTDKNTLRIFLILIALIFLVFILIFILIELRKLKKQIKTQTQQDKTPTRQDLPLKKQTKTSKRKIEYYYE